MRSRLFPTNFVSDCLRFLKFQPQFCESCGAIYRWICETFSALQSTSGPVTKKTKTTKKNKKKQTTHFRTYSRRALYDLPQSLHGDRARRAHHKSVIHFSTQKHRPTKDNAYWQELVSVYREWR